MKEIIEENKLIAEFMGYKVGSLHGWMSGEVKDMVYKDGGDDILGKTKELKYHSSWDWLMPVVEKIGQHYDHKQFNPNLEILSLSIFAEINTVWHCVIDFIKWYNQNK